MSALFLSNIIGFRQCTHVKVFCLRIFSKSCRNATFFEGRENAKIHIDMLKIGVVLPKFGNISWILRKNNKDIINENERRSFKVKYEQASMIIEYLEPIDTLSVSEESGGNDTTITSLDETADDGILQ